MKKLYILVVLMLLTGTSLWAKQVDVNKARDIAQQFLQRQSLTRSAEQSLQLAYTATSDAATRSQVNNLFYVFDRGGKSGFVVVAADDRLRPVLGYTDSGSFDANTKNDGFQWWLSAITAKAKAVVSESDGEAYSATSSSSSSVEPLVKTKWKQEEPFNNLCPFDNTHGAQSVTGCVATAMAQILYTCYSDTTQTLSGTVACRPKAHATTTTNVDLSQFTIDYTKMELEYDGDESDEAKEAVATLMYACGLSVNMNYCSNASSSNASSYVFMKYFGIGSTCQRAFRAQYTSDEWDSLIRGELDNGRPMIYAGATLGGAGHAFVCDGYNTDGLYHINWGWGGYQDGYYDFYSLDFSYVNDQDIVYGIKPGKSEIYASDLLSYSTLTSSASATSTYYKVGNLSCFGGNFDGYISLAICKSDGSIAATGDAEKLTLEDGQYYQYYPSYGLNITIPKNLADGTYTLRLTAGLKNDKSDMHLVNVGGSRGYLTITVKNGKATVTGYQQDAAKLSLESYTVDDDGCGYVGYETPITLYVKNSGGEFYGTIYSDKAATVKASIKAGETAEIKTYITPTIEGKQEFSFWGIDEYSSDSIAISGTATVEVLAESEAISKLVVDSVAFVNPDLTYGDSAVVAVTLHNEGGKYSGYIDLVYDVFLRSENARGTATWYSDYITLELYRNDSTTIYINLGNAYAYDSYYYGTLTVTSLVYYNNGWRNLATYSGNDAPKCTMRQEQTISWEQTFEDVHADSLITLQATASSGLAIEYVITSGEEFAEIVNGYTLKCNAAGTVVVEARQAGSDAYKPAESVTMKIEIAEDTGIDGVKASDGLAVSASDFAVIVNGTSGNEIIRIYSLSGSLVKEVVAESGCTTIGGLTHGQSYIVSVKGKNVKIAL